MFFGIAASTVRDLVLEKCVRFSGKARLALRGREAWSNTNSHDTFGSATQIADWLVALTNTKKAWGFGLYCLHLRNAKGLG